MLTDSQRAALAARLRRGRDNGAAQIPRRPAGTQSLPLSYAQEQLWFIDRFAPGLPTYNVPNALRLSGPLDTAALHRAINALAARHEALRTRLVTNPDGRPVQVIDPPAPVDLTVTDCMDLAPQVASQRLREVKAREAMRPFESAHDRLLRTSLVRLAADEHVLMVVVHHTVFDGVSAGVFTRELAALYQQEASGQPAALAELPVQFADYALWERDRLQGGALEELESYWRQVMTGFETVQFPTDRPRPVLDNFDGALAQHMTDRALLDGLRQVSRREGTTLFVTLLTGLFALLYRYTGQTDLVVGTVSANRGRSELAPLIGFLVNTLPVRADLSGDPAFTDLLAQVKQATVGAYAHQDLPFAKIVETLRVDRDPSRAPIFQITLAYAERDTTRITAAGTEFLITDLGVDNPPAKFDLTLAVEARDEGLWLECSYKSGLFDAGTVRRLLGHAEVLLRGVVADPAARLSRLPVLTGQELHRELVAWNDTAATFAPVCIHQGFEAQAGRTPDAIAAEFEGRQLSYAQLNRWANQIARRLRAAGVGPEVLVGVCMRAGLARLAALLGVWKAGGGYVPLDPALPAERLAFMMADTAMAVVLTDQPSAPAVPASPAVTALCLDSQPPPATAPHHATQYHTARHHPGADHIPDGAGVDGPGVDGTGVTPANVAYVIYTSGSTGQPKGVVVEHRQAINFLQGTVDYWHVDASDVVLQFASFAFDASVMDMFMPLLAGARVVLAAAETLHSPQRLAALMRERRVTFALLPPAVLSLLGQEQFADLRVLMAGGEELPSELALRWMGQDLRFVNTYGPTEATVTAAFHELDATTQLPPPIGGPNWPNYQVYVLDAHLNPVPVGVAGELHIGGAGVARGYLNRPELTRQRFIPDPFTPGQRLYKTGDLVRRRPDGTIMFLGRADNQVKIRGLRIELGEIETTLAAHPAVAQAVVTVVTDPAGEKQLAAYLRPKEPTAIPAPAQLRAHLARTLPDYMIPAHLVTVDAFPLNASGKIDRSALPAPGRVPSATEPVAPATFTETVLVDLYAAVLNREQVGVADSFFDIGGSSLQVMRLVNMIYEEIGVDVGVATIFLHPTPRQLAASVDAIRSGRGQSAGSGPVVELNTGIGELPMFMIHPVGGTVFAYTHLARELAGTFKVFGMQAPGLTEPAATAASIAGLADDYTDRIRAAQPAGPYRLAGWSMGGIVAFEVARRLEQAGAEVALLTLIDAAFCVPDTTVPAESQLAGMFLADAAHSLGWNTADAPDPASSTAAEQLAWLAERLAAGDDGADMQASLTRLLPRFDVFQAHIRMLAGYRPRPPAVRAPTLIASADHSPNSPARAHWPRVLGGAVCTVRVDGDHYSLLRPPLVAEVGMSILKWHSDCE